MKKLIFLLLFPIAIFSQELTLNTGTSIYEYSVVNENLKPKIELIQDFKNKMIELNYSNLIVDENKIIGNNFISFLIMMTTIQVNYQVIIDFKDNKHRILFTRFVVDDKRFSPIPIEDLKKHTKKWVSEINKKLPTSVKAICSPISKW